jgi:long-chain acyl-CoA synthetase
MLLENGDLEMNKLWFRSWPKDVPKHIAFPKISLAALLTKSAEKHPNKTALIYFDAKMDYRELDLLSNRFARAMVDLGVKKGDRIALFLPNIPQFVIAYYGAIKSGAIVTAISSMYKEREVEFQLRDSGAETIVALDLFYPIVSKVMKKTRLKRVIIARLKDYMPRTKAFLGALFKKIPSYKVKLKPNIFRFRDLIDNYDRSSPRVKFDPKQDVAVLQYTGGTTGIPKGAMLTHMNLVSNTLMCSEWIGPQTDPSFLSVLPLFHIYGMMTGLNYPIHAGAKIILLPRFDLKLILQSIQKYKITHFCGVPTLYSKLLSYPDLKKYECSSLQFCISGASSLPIEVKNEFNKLIKGVLVEGYGLSEASPVTHCNPLTSPKILKTGSIGIPWPDTDAKIVDQNKGEKVLEPGQIGEIVVKGPQIMKGYWNMPSETALVLRDGWLYTGDIGRMDEDGYFYFVNRKKDLIKSKGFSVYPRELEEVLHEHPAIKICSVIGKPDSVAGEVPKAFVVLNKGATVTEKELLSFVNDKVAKYKAITEIEFRKELPMTILGKVRKQALR